MGATTFMKLQYIYACWKVIVNQIYSFISLRLGSKNLLWRAVIHSNPRGPSTLQPCWRRTIVARMRHQVSPASVRTRCASRAQSSRQPAAILLSSSARETKLYGKQHVFPFDLKKKPLIFDRFSSHCCEHSPWIWGWSSPGVLELPDNCKLQFTFQQWSRGYSWNKKLKEAALIWLRLMSEIH